MKRTLAIFAGLTMVSPAFGASVIIDGASGATVKIGTFGSDIEFTSTLLSDSPTDFTVVVYGLIQADPRWCASQLPGPVPPDCDAPIDPFSAGFTLTASLPWPEYQAVLVPIFGYAVDGYLHFGPTRGGRVEIDVDGTAVPEPMSWTMMFGGLGLVGGAMRSRKRMSAVSFG